MVMLRVINNSNPTPPNNRDNPNILNPVDRITGFSPGSRGMPAQRLVDTLIKPCYERLKVGITPTSPEIRLARKLSGEIMGLSHRYCPQIFTANNVKIVKSNKMQRDLSYVSHLAPYDLSGFNTCQYASPGCIKACLNTSGHGAYSSTQASRIRYTRLLFKFKQLFGVLLYGEIAKLQRSSAKKGLGLSLRLNGTSDLPWERVYPWLFTLPALEGITFYDYTKDPSRLGETPSNYHLTLSRTEANDLDCIDALIKGFNVAVVFAPDGDKILPNFWQGFPVLDGTLDDRRYADPAGHVVGLAPLAQAKKDSSGFVV